MDEEKAVVPRLRFRSRAEAAQLAAEFEASGLTRRAFCEKHNLTVSTLDSYRKRPGPQVGELPAGGGEAGGKSRWVAVELGGHRPMARNGADSGLALALPGGRRIEIGRGFDAGTLRQLVRALEQI